MQVGAKTGETNMSDESVVIVPYQSGRALARTVQVLLALFILGSLPQSGVSLATVPIWHSVIESATVEEAADPLKAVIDMSYLGANLKQVTAFVAFAIVISFLVWLLRVHENLPALGLRKLTYSSAWVLGWWFIPFLNLYLPFKVLLEIWIGSDPEFDGAEVSESADSPALVGWWWATFASSIMLLFYLGPATDEWGFSMTGRLYLEAAANIMIIIAGILALIMVGSISSMQDRKAAARGG